MQQKFIFKSLLVFVGVIKSLSASEPESTLTTQSTNLSLEGVCESIRYISPEERVRLKPTCKALCRYVDELHEHKDYLEEFVFTLVQKKQYGMLVLRPKKPKIPKQRDTEFPRLRNLVFVRKSDFKVPSNIQELHLMCEGKWYQPFDNEPADMFNGAQYTFWLFMYGVRDGFAPLVRYSLGMSQTFDNSSSHPLANLLNFLREHPQQRVDLLDLYKIPSAWFTIPAITTHNTFKLIDIIFEDSVCRDFFFNLWSLLRKDEVKISFPVFNISCILSSPELFSYLTSKESFRNVCTNFINSNELKNIEISNNQINRMMSQTILKLDSLQIFPTIAKVQSSPFNDYAPITELDGTLYDISTNKESYTVFSQKPSSFIPTLSAVGCFIQRYNEILLLKRASHKAEGNTWGIPGGKVESSETPLQAILREVKEETGILIDSEKAKDIGTNYLYLSNKRVAFHMYHLWLNKDKPEIILSADEHVDYRWVSVETALQMDLMPGEIESFVRYYQAMGMRFPLFCNANMRRCLPQ